MQPPQPGPLDGNGNELGRLQQLIAGEKAVAALTAPPASAPPRSAARARATPPTLLQVRIIKLTPVRIFSRSASQMSQSRAGHHGSAVTSNSDGGD
jgi:hypothetical protein